MGLLTWPFQLPLVPLRAVTRLAEILQEQAEQELYNPAAVQRQLEEAQEARDTGRLSDDELTQVEYEAVGRLVQPQPGGAPTSRRAGGKE